MRLTCEICKKKFEAKLFRKGCSKACSRQAMKKPRKNSWQEEELEVLEELSGIKPLPAITRAVRKVDAEHGWPLRTQKAVSGKMFALGLSLRCEEDNISLRSLARILGVNPTAVFSWKEKGLPYRNYGKTRYCYIPVSKLTEWAIANPKHFEGLEYDRLLWLFNDPDIARELSNKKLNRQGVKISVQQVMSRQVFESVSAAALATSVSRDRLFRAASKARQQGQTHFTVDSVRWKLLQEEQRHAS